MSKETTIIMCQQYDNLIDKIIAKTDRMVAVNHMDKLAIPYNKAKAYIEFFAPRNDLTENMKCDLARYQQYCQIIDNLRSEECLGE